MESRKPEGFRFHLAIKEASGDFIPAVDLKPALRELFAGYRFPEGHPVGSVADIKRYYAALSEKQGFDVDVPSQTMTFEGDRLTRSGKAKEAIRVFQMNVEAFPASPNVYDSLAEAYMSSGDSKRAVRNYRKSLELNPGNQNAKQMLEKLEQDGK